MKKPTLSVSLKSLKRNSEKKHQKERIGQPQESMASKITGGRSLHRHRKRCQNHSRAGTKILPGYQNGGRRGRTVLLPKTKNLSDEKNYRPIICLNTSYKILTGLVAKYMREHALVNETWDEGQLGGVKGMLGTVDQLINQ